MTLDQQFELSFAKGIILPLLGSHLSMAGGYFNAVDAAALGMDTVHLFTKNCPV